MKKEIIIFIHLILIIAIWLSPFFVSWKIILLFIILYYTQLSIFGNCILTQKQFKSKKREDTFYSYILERIGFNVNKNLIRILADYIFPWIIFLIAITLQL
jgi:hypothetical protein